jgi:acyl dehydratase
MRDVNTVEPPNLYFEDLKDNQEFESVQKGPILVGHQVRWAGAIDNYDSEFHHDEHVAKAQGLPGLILSGPLIAAWLLSAIHHWVGRNARVLHYTDRNVGSTMPRDMLSLKGKVVRAYRRNGDCFLDLECNVQNQKGEFTTPATATVKIASRSKR